MSNTKKKMIFAFFITLLAVVVLVASSYAWMTLSSSPVVSDLALSLVAENALEIAPDVDGTPGEWGSILDLSDPSIRATKLKPVALSGEDFAFLVPRYGIDGRIAKLDEIRLADQDTDRTSSAAADTEDLQDYLFTYTFYIRTDATDCTISLAPPSPRDSEHLEGQGCFVIGEPVWNEATLLHDELGKGAQNAVRIGFYIEECDYEEAQFIIYEPNADAGKANDVDYDGTYKVIRQKTSTFTETDPVLADSVVYHQGEFLDEDTDLFYLQGGTERRVTLFLWIEGRDLDSSNAISEGQIFANLQLSGKEHHSDNPIYHD